MPSLEDRLIIPNNFESDCHIPGVIGAIDGTHIRISKPPGELGEIFMNRKGFWSINCQLVCDCFMRFMNIVAR